MADSLRGDMDVQPTSVATGASVFARLLAPVAVDAFLADFWEVDALHIQGDGRARFPDLPGLDDLDELVTATTAGRTASGGDRIVRTDARGEITGREIPLDEDGIPDIRQVYRAYSQGFTLVLNRVHRRSSSVARVCRGIESALQHPVGANLYATPRNVQGFRPHVDTHDVFILQVHGTKVWHVAAPGSDLPLRRQTRRLPGMPDGFRSWTMRPGDVLYLPRGLAHEATTLPDASSVHLTIGVHVYRWVDLLRTALDLSAERDVALRQALPPGVLTADLDRTHLFRLVEQFAAELKGTLLAAAALERLVGSLLTAGKAAEEGHLRSLDGLDALSDISVVQRVQGQFCRVRTTPEEATIEFASNYVAGPAQIAPALRFVAEHERFAVAELPGALSEQDRLDLVTRLVTEGLLRLGEPTPGGPL